MKTDLTKQFRDYYRAGKAPEVAEHAPGVYVAIDGGGEPGGEEFSQKVSALYSVAYGVKKIAKAEGRDFAVPKLEGLWWVAPGQDARRTPRSQWRWSLRVRLPEFVGEEWVARAQAETVKKKALRLAEEVRHERMENGKCVQVMHTGSYQEEAETIDALHTFLNQQGLKETGRHHEIYLSDPRKTVASKMKTILRQPVV